MAHEKVMEKEIPVLKEEPEQVVVVQEETHLPKKPEEPMLLSKYPMIMELDVELKRKNEEIFTVEQERGKLKIELSECIGVFKQKQRKELQERIHFWIKKVQDECRAFTGTRVPDMLMLRNSLSELFAVREEKRKYEETCKNSRRSALRRRLRQPKESPVFWGCKVT